MFQKSDLCRENDILTQFTIDTAIETRFGLNPENLSQSLSKDAYELLIYRFPNIETHDVQNAYKYSKIQKKEGQKLTVDELLEPVNVYWMKKMRAKAEFEEIEEEQKKESARDSEEQKYKDQCRDKYLESLKKGEWIGNEFEALAIARNIRESFSDEDLKIIRQNARDEVNRLRKVNEENTAKSIYERIPQNQNVSEIIAPNYQRIKAQFYVKECVKRGYFFIQE